MPTEPIRLLFVEDMQSDWELALHAINAENIGHISSRVDNRIEFTTALTEFKPDIIVSDFWLPNFTGMEVLEFVRANHPEIPVIIVTGSLNEETAVTCIKSGASDYLLKDKLKRLPFAILEALSRRNAELLKREARKALHISEQRFKEVSELVGDFIWELNAEGTFTYSNKLIKNILGFAPEDLLGKKKFYDLYPPELREEFKTITLEKIYKRESFINFLTPVIHKQGQTVYLETSGLPVFSSEGELVGYRGVSRDVTERKNKEESLKVRNVELGKKVERSSREIVQLSRLNQAIITNLGLAVISTSLDGTIQSFNPEAERMSGYSKDEVIGKYAIHVLQFPEKEHRGSYCIDLKPKNLHETLDFERLINTNLNQRSFNAEMLLQNKSGDLLSVQLTVNTLEDESGQLTGYVGVVADISERIQMMDALKQSEALFRTMFTEHGAIMFLVDPETGIIEEANKSATDFYGYAFDGPEKIPIANINVLEYGELKAEMKKAESRQLNYFVFKHRLASGEIRTVEVHSTPITVKNKKLLFSIIHDITERSRAEEMLIRSEAENRAIVSAVPDLLFRIHKDGTYLESYSNNSASLYVPKEAFIGKKIAEVLPPELAEKSLSVLKESFDKKDILSYEYPLSINGKMHYFENRVISINEQEALSIIRDITERKESEFRLRLQNAAFESFALAMIITDTNGIIEWVNPAFTKLTGYEVHESIGNKPSILKSGKQSREFYRELWDKLNEGKVWSGEMINKRKDGSLYFEEQTITPVIDNDGNVIRFIAIKIDISHRKEMEEALRLSEQRWQFALEGSGDGVWDWNADSDEVFFSRQWKAMLGYEEHEIQNKLSEWSTRVHPDDLQKCYDALEEHFKGLTPLYINEHRVRCKNGSYKWILDRGKVVEWKEDNTPRRVIGTHTDITQSKELQEMLLATIEKERELNEMKSRFVATASHEFRTPLASILIICDTLLEYWKRLEEKQISERLEKIKEQTLHLSTVVNNVLQLSKIQQGKLAFNPESIELGQVCKTAMESFNSDPLSMTRLKLKMDLPDIYLYMDKGLMVQSINNLISNALKYSAWDQEVQIQIEKSTESIKIQVIDKGMGIPLEEQKHLFTPFFRASNTRLIQGNGLGLNIVKEAVRLHGGDISFESFPDKGTTFTISLPLSLVIN